MAECQCRTEAADYRKNVGQTFSLHSGIKYDFSTSRVTPSASGYGQAGCIFSATSGLDV
jgi:hypothetical protein